MLTTASRYRNPGALPDGGVLVVGPRPPACRSPTSSPAPDGASCSPRAGTRMPRRYRGLDVFWWLERTGRLARTIDEVRDPAAARNEPSLQLVGRNEPDRSAEDLDLAALAGQGVRVTGRLRAVSGGVASFEDSLPAAVAESDARMHRFLDAVDAHVDAAGLGPEVWAPLRPGPSRCTASRPGWT